MAPNSCMATIAQPAVAIRPVLLCDCCFFLFSLGSTYAARPDLGQPASSYCYDAYSAGRHNAPAHHCIARSYCLRQREKCLERIQHRSCGTAAGLACGSACTVICACCCWLAAQVLGLASHSAEIRLVKGVGSLCCVAIPKAV